MYIELYLLDNLIMNALILRLASRLLGLKPAYGRIFILSAIGALCAFMALMIPGLLSFPAKLALCLLMALGVPFSSFRGYLFGVASVVIATFVAGGMTYALALTLEGGFFNGILTASLPLRVFLYCVFLMLFAPAIFRRMRNKRVINSIKLPLQIVHEGTTHDFVAILDSGNTMFDPLTGLPAIIVASKSLTQYAKLPAPCSTVLNDEGRLYGFFPGKVLLQGQSISAFVCVLSNPLNSDFDALVPLNALPVDYKTKMEDDGICMRRLKAFLDGLSLRFIQALKKLRGFIISVWEKRFRRL